MNKQVKKLLYAILLYPLYIISKIIPKSDNVWIFGAWYGNRYSDNTAYLFEYVNREKVGIDAIWLSKKEEIVSKIRSRGFRAYNKNSIFGFWYGCRAVITFINSGYNDVNIYAIGKSIKVQLWHGIPLKKIKYDDTINENRYHNPVYRNIKSILLIIFPFLNEKWDFIISSSDEVTKRLSSAFRVKKNKIIESGYPRMDIILSPNKEYLDPFQIYQVGKDIEKIILYAPTHRKEGFGGKDLFDSMDFSKFNDFLVRKNVMLLVKMHYYHELINNYLFNRSLSNIIYLKENDVPDINHLLPFIDVLISDYSGVLLDYLILNRPIICTSFDLEIYIKQDRELYEDYDKTVKGINCMNWCEVQDQLQNILSGKDLSINLRTEMLQRFFHYHDKNNCKRIVDTVTNYLSRSS